MATRVDPISASSRRVNLYEVLQVSPKASPEVIQAAYRALARAYHPDVNASPDAARQMRQLNAAYGVLSDPERRARYDAMRLRPARARRDMPPADDESVAARPRPTYVRAVPVAPPPPSGAPRVGRLIAVLLFMVLIVSTAIYGLWLIAGALDDEPTRAMAPLQVDYGQSDQAPSQSLLSVPAEIMSSAVRHNDGPQTFGR